MPSTFFKQTSTPSLMTSINKKNRKATFVNVGGNGDCGFRSVAAGIIDNFLTHPRANQELYERFLKPYLKIYGSQHVPGRFLTPVERAEGILSNPSNMAETIRNLAFTLRQIAVDEMNAHPENYAGAFIEQHENTSPADMRKPTTWIDENAICALANAIHLPINVSMVLPSKGSLTFHYGQQIEKPSGETIVIQLQNKHYFPQVTQVNLFETVSTQPVRTTPPIIYQPHPDPDMSEVMKRIEESEKRLVDDFHHHFNRLMAMVDAGEIDKERLINVYVSGLGKSDYLQGRIREVGIEYGNQQFFADVLARAKGEPRPINVNQDGQEKHDAEVTKELAHAIARAISIGHMDADFVYAQIENAQERPAPSLSVA